MNMNPSFTARRANRGSVYLGIAGGLLVAAGGMFGAYFVTQHKAGEARAATAAPTAKADGSATGGSGGALDLDSAIAALSGLKARMDRGATDAYLDLEQRTVNAERAGVGLDVLGSLPRLEAAARAAAPTLELATVPVPARVTRDSLGIDDISSVLG